MLGNTRVTGVKTMSRDLSLVSSKNYLGSDYSLKLVSMKQKSLVIVDNLVTMNFFKLCTHRPSYSKNFFGLKGV